MRHVSHALLEAALEITKWGASSGTVNPLVGATTVWDPYEKGETFTVTARLDDSPGPVDDTYKEVTTEVGAFIAHITQTGTIAGQAEPTGAITGWRDEDGEGHNDIISLNFYMHDSISGAWDSPKYGSAGSQWLFTLDPQDAVPQPGGMVYGEIWTDGLVTEWATVDDTDPWDGNVNIRLSVSFNAGGVGFGITSDQIKIKGDNSEGVAVVACGFDSTERFLGLSRPESQRIDLCSSQVKEDALPFSEMNSKKHTQTAIRIQNKGDILAAKWDLHTHAKCWGDGMASANAAGIVHFEILYVDYVK